MDRNTFTLFLLILLNFLFLSWNLFWPNALSSSKPNSLQNSNTHYDSFFLLSQIFAINNQINEHITSLSSQNFYSKETSDSLITSINLLKKNLDTTLTNLDDQSKKISGVGCGTIRDISFMESDCMNSAIGSRDQIQYLKEKLVVCQDKCMTLENEKRIITEYQKLAGKVNKYNYSNEMKKKDEQIRNEGKEELLFVEGPKDGILRFPVNKWLLQNNEYNTSYWVPIQDNYEWNIQNTGVIIVDMWNGHWCKSFQERALQLIPSHNRFINQLRKWGVTIIHIPSDTPKSNCDYESAHRTEKLNEEVQAKTPPVIHQIYSSIPQQLPVRVDGDCDGNILGQPPIGPHKDIIVDQEKDYMICNEFDTDYLYSILKRHNITKLFYTGIALNMCVMHKEFGLKKTVSRGFGKSNIVMVGDLTEPIYEPKDWPYVNVEEATQLILDYIGKYIASYSSSTSIIKSSSTSIPPSQIPFSPTPSSLTPTPSFPTPSSQTLTPSPTPSSPTPSSPTPSSPTPSSPSPTLSSPSPTPSFPSPTPSFPTPSSPSPTPSSPISSS